METIYGSSNWTLTVRREKDHVVILRAVTCDARAQLPEELFALPVTVLGESMTLPQVIGGALILGFTLWNEITPREKR